MRRLEREETLHGTRDGQIAVDRSLRAQLGLTEREAVCATLLASGLSPADIATRLDISPSTTEKHLAALRRKLGVRTTHEAVVKLLRAEGEATARISDRFGEAAAVDTGFPAALERARAERYRSAGSLTEVLGEALAALTSDDARALLYFGLPLAAASYRKLDLIQAQAGPDAVVEVYLEARNRFLEVLGPRLFASPDGVVVVDLDAPEAGDAHLDAALARRCKHAGVHAWVALGIPHGAGYFVLCGLFGSGPSREGSRAWAARVEHLRFEFRLAQNAAFSFGALAREVGLTQRERDALSLLAEGHSNVEAAERLGISDRALAQHVLSARTKLGAATTTEAVAKAMAMNALVFL